MAWIAERRLSRERPLRLIGEEKSSAQASRSTSVAGWKQLFNCRRHHFSSTGSAFLVQLIFHKGRKRIAISSEMFSVLLGVPARVLMWVCGFDDLIAQQIFRPRRYKVLGWWTYRCKVCGWREPHCSINIINLITTRCGVTQFQMNLSWWDVGSVT